MTPCVLVVEENGAVAASTVVASGHSHVLAADGTDGFELIHKPYSIDQVSRILRRAVATSARARARAAWPARRSPVGTEQPFQRTRLSG